MLPIDDTSFLTVEYLDQSGLNSWLPESGVVVTLVDLAQTPRVQQNVSGEPPFTDLLSPGDEWSGYGWDVAAGSAGVVTATGSP